MTPVTVFTPTEHSNDMDSVCVVKGVLLFVTPLVCLLCVFLLLKDNLTNLLEMLTLIELIADSEFTQFNKMSRNKGKIFCTDS